MTAKRILVVDDDPDVAEAVGRTARRVGFDAMMATSPAEALDHAALWRPNVITMDLRMPDLDGPRFLEALADRRCDAQILIVSGEDWATIEAARSLGQGLGLNIAGVIQKPLRLPTLRAALSSV